MGERFEPRRKAAEYEQFWVQEWKKNRTFEQSIAQRDAKQSYVFYDGPPFITGAPHHGTLLSSIVKDAVPRFWTMQGKRVERRWGWDCHGLPAENFVEKQLAIEDRRQIGASAPIEKDGKTLPPISLEEYITKAHESMVANSETWESVIDRVGRWVDFKHSYKTMDKEFMESVWWAFKQLYEQGKIYEGEKVLMYDTKFATPVSKSEVTMDNDAYQTVTDPSVYVKFKLKGEDKYLLAWTTTPWTLPANTAIAVNPDIVYAEVETADGIFIVAKKLVKEVFIYDEHEKNEFKVIRELKGSELVGLEYEPLLGDESMTYGVVSIPFGKSEASYSNWLKVYPADYVETNAGTGIVHIAPIYGETDFELAELMDIPKLHVIDDNGYYLSDVAKVLHEIGVRDTDENGIEVWVANKYIAKCLEEQGIVYKIDYIQHEYPFNPRSKQRIMYRAIPSWFFNVQDDKALLLSQNESINWVPEHLKHGRFAKNIEQAPDWTLSRNRFWATAIPVWKGDKGTVKVVGSYAELAELAISHEGLKGDLVAGLLDGTKTKTLRLADSERPNPKRYQVGDIVKFVNSDTGAAAGYAELVAKDDLRLGDVPLDLPGHLPVYQSYDDMIEQFQQYYPALTISRETKLTVYEYKFLGPELPAGAGQLEDYHRPWVDQIEFDLDGEHFKRIPEVLDCWFESGSMPFAQLHYPFENKEKFEQSYPADFIVEYIGQIRAWFYYVHVINTALFGENAYKNVITTGVVAGNDGRKMSKSLGNFTDPTIVMDIYSADALRFLLLSSPLLSGEDFALQDKDVSDVQRKLAMIWNMYDFFALYANIDDWSPSGEPVRSKELQNPLDQWIIARLHQLKADLTKNMEAYNIPDALAGVLPFIDDASNWFVRRSRRRFWKSENDEDKNEAYATLYTVLTQLALVLAPFTPFLAEELWSKMGQEGSVHLRDWPPVGTIEPQVLDDMAVARAIIEQALALRAEKHDGFGSVKIRQPLASLTYGGTKLAEFYEQMIADETNVKNVIHAAGEIVSIDKQLTPALQAEGEMRELVRAIQGLRKASGLAVDDHIKLSISGTDLAPELLEILQKETLVDQLTQDNYAHDQLLQLNDKNITISLERV